MSVVVFRRYIINVILAIDLGTTGNRVIAFDLHGSVAARSYYEFPQIFPKPGWVEHNPMDIWNTTRKALNDVLSKVGKDNVAAIGITNQRETTVLWDRKTGKPVYNAIVWQCRRTRDYCQTLASHARTVRRKTGLFIDPYFSATKIRWILDNVPGVRQRVRRGDIFFGTVDAWILWNLTGGTVHATDPGNAARTMVYNIRTLSYDEELLNLFGLKGVHFPEVRESAGNFGMTDPKITGRAIPVTAILGDQQASLFAQGGWEKGLLKTTYGTGLFMMAVTDKILPDPGSLVSTIAWKINGTVSYAVEGSVCVGGSCIQWLRDGLKILEKSPDSEPMATSLASNEGVYFVPALTGLGAPYWDPQARGLIIGITRGTRREHIARAALEAIAYQVKDLAVIMSDIAGKKYRTMRVDGGATMNNFLMQFQADILPMRIERPLIIETTALGAAGLAGIAAGFWSQKEYAAVRRLERTFIPEMNKKKRDALYARWKDAVKRSFNWEQ